MSEVFFVLTVIYIAYVIYGVSDDEVQIDQPTKPDIASTKKSPVPPEEVEVARKSPAKPQESTAKSTPDKAVAKTGSPTEAKIKKTAAPKIELRTVEMKNPKTGEQAKVANNYRMVKRWVKEALVEEQLLEKIYKNSELDDEAKVKVAKALSIIKAMDKYKV